MNIGFEILKFIVGVAGFVLSMALLLRSNDISIKIGRFVLDLFYGKDEPYEDEEVDKHGYTKKERFEMRVGAAVWLLIMAILFLYMLLLRKIKLPLLH